MVIYNLDETPDVFITVHYYDNKFLYAMVQINSEESRKQIGSIDLQSDKLIIHGTQIKESMSKRLYESLVFRPKAGIIYVNCDGACYVRFERKLYRPIHNVIFDWSSFGVIVPNSQCDLANIEVGSTKASLDASKDEVFELKKVGNDLGLKLEKAYEKVALLDFELQLYKIELESSKKESDEFLDELCNCKDEGKKMKDKLSSEISCLSKRNCDLEMKSEILECEVSLLRSEFHSTKDQLTFSSKNVKELEGQLEERVKMEVELQKVQNQLWSEICCFEKKNLELEMKSKMLEKACQKITLVDFELDLYKIELESSKKEVDQLLDELHNCKEESAKMEVELHKMQGLRSSETSSFNKRNQELEMVLEKLEDELSLVRSELKSTTDQQMNEVDNFMKEKKSMENELSLVSSELQTTKDQLEFLNKHVNEADKRFINCENERQGIEKELEKNQKMQDQVCMANKEAQDKMIVLESILKREIEELKEQKSSRKMLARLICR